MAVVIITEKMDSSHILKMQLQNMTCSERRDSFLLSFFKRLKRDPFYFFNRCTIKYVVFCHYCI